MNYADAMEILRDNGIKFQVVTQSPINKILRIIVYGEGIMMQSKAEKIIELLPGFKVQRGDQENIYIEKAK